MHTLFALILKPKNIIFVIIFFPWKQTKKLLLMILQVLNKVFIIWNMIKYWNVC